MITVLQAIDYTVVMCGDGANDCAALKVSRGFQRLYRHSLFQTDYFPLFLWRNRILCFNLQGGCELHGGGISQWCREFLVCDSLF